ncbi:MAG: AMP-binding protein, partial [Chloroflexota bacterium]
MNLFDRFEQNVHVHPNKPAFIYFHKRKWKTLTYQDIFDQTQRFLRGLEAGPLTSGLTAALLTPPSPEFFPFALALLKFGIVPILAEPALGIKKIGEIYAEAKPDIFVGNTLTHTLRLIFGWGRESVKYNLTIRKVEGRKSKVGPSSIVHRPSYEPAAIIYTSGSTGLPKGAIYTQDNLAAQLDLLKNTFQITSDEIDLPAFPIYALIDLLFGVTSVIPDISFPIPGKTDAAKVIDAIQKFNVTNMFASPVVLELLSSFAEKNPSASRPILLPSLKRIITAGAPATIDLQK